MPFLFIAEMYLIIQCHVWRDKILWRERSWTFSYQIYPVSINKGERILYYAKITWYYPKMTWYVLFSSCPFLELGWRVIIKKNLMVLRIGCSKECTPSLLILFNWQSTAGKERMCPLLLEIRVMMTFSWWCSIKNYGKL